MMRIRVLGCSGGISAGARTSSLLIDDDILLDAGTGVGDLSLAELARIRHVFLTHSHIDHIASLPLLVDSLFSGLNGDIVTVHARAETIDALRTHIFNDVIWPDFTLLPNAESAVMRYAVCNPGDTVEIGERSFTAVAVEHTVPSQGYVLRNCGCAFAISGDTSSNKTLWPHLNAVENLKALIVEVSFPNELAELARDSGHYVPLTMAEDLNQLQHEPEIWLNAMKPGAEETILRQVRDLLPDRGVRVLELGTTFEI